MKIGVNWLTPHALPIVRRLLDEGVADFCEIMVDNAIHLPPEKILAALPNIPLALHIVSSHFLTKSETELQKVANHLRPWIASLNPIYVSDHLPQLNYQIDYERTCARVKMWQALLGVKLLLENNASLGVQGVGQAEFYAQLMNDAGCELLFDFSNAYIAQHNGAQQFAAWQSLVRQCQHFHVAGFRIDPHTNLAYDTHDVPVASEVLASMRSALSGVDNKSRSLVIEFDTKLNVEEAKEQILRISAALAAGSSDPLRDVRPCTRRFMPFMAATPFVASLDPAANAAFSAGVKRQHIKDQLIKAVTEWSLRGLDHIAAKGIIMRSRHCGNLAVGLWKNSEPDQPAKVVILDISAANLPPADAYAISYQTGSWNNLRWEKAVY